MDEDEDNESRVEECKECGRRDYSGPGVNEGSRLLRSRIPIPQSSLEKHWVSLSTSLKINESWIMNSFDREMFSQISESE